MAMSRLAGGRLFTVRSPIWIVPPPMRFEAGDHAQQRRLAAAGRSDQHDELPVRDVDADAMQHLHGSESLRHIADRHLRHRPPLACQQALSGAKLING